MTGDIFVAGQDVEVVTSSAKNLFAAGQKVEVSKETTITSNWIANTYTVTLNANGGVLTSVTYGEPIEE